MAKQLPSILLTEFIVGMNPTCADTSHAAGQLGGSVAHELRNLFGVISACAQVIGEAPDDQEFVATCADRIQQSVERASRIVSGLNRLARTGMIQTEDVVLQDVVEEVLAVMGHHMATYQIAAKSVFAPQPSLVRVYPGLCMQLLVLMLSACLDGAGYGATVAIHTVAREDAMELCVHVQRSGTVPAYLPPYEAGTPELVAQRLLRSEQLASMLSADLDLSQVDAFEPSVRVRLPFAPFDIPSISHR